MTQREQFMSWWKDDPERTKCFLGQAMDAYVKSFPARVLPLLEEVFLPYKCPRCGQEVEQGPPEECIYCCKSNLLPSTTDHDLSVPGIAEQGDHTERPVEGGVSLGLCRDCYYYEAVCKRYPPTPDQEELREDEWCGEWRRMET